MGDCSDGDFAASPKAHVPIGGLCRSGDRLRRHVRELIGPLDAELASASQCRDARRPIGQARPATQPPIGIVAERCRLPNWYRRRLLSTDGSEEG